MPSEHRDDLTTEQIRTILDAHNAGKSDPEVARVLRWAADSSREQESLQLQIRKQELDFTTILEIANQINAKSLDSHGIESYIGYIVSTTRGKFAVSKVFLLRQFDLESSRIAHISPRGDGKILFEFDASGPFGSKIRQVAAPFFLHQLDPQEWKFSEVDYLRSCELELCIPLVRRDAQSGNDLKGLLCLGKRFVKQPYTESELKFMGLLSDMIAISLHNAQLHRRSIVDALTQVYSRGHFDMHLVMEVARAERYARVQRPEEPRCVSLILADIDHFKRINDTYGHQVGDACLRSVAGALREAVRKSDIIARYGGEEFALVAPETNKEECFLLADRLRKRVAAIRVDTASGPVSVTASFGVAAYPPDANDTRALVAVADKALYRAKELGRNRVEKA